MKTTATSATHSHINTHQNTNYSLLELALYTPQALIDPLNHNKLIDLLVELEAWRSMHDDPLLDLNRIGSSIYSIETPRDTLEYITYLEEQNSLLTSENEELQEKIIILEEMIDRLNSTEE